MQRLEDTLAGLSPGVASVSPKPGAYNPRKGLAIYFLPCGGPPLTSSGSVLGEALAGKSGLGCTMLEGVPASLPSGAVLVALYEDLKRKRPDLVADLPVPARVSEYVIDIGASTLVLAKDRQGLVHGMQTLAMIILRHGEPLIPAGTIQDSPRCRSRGIAVELCPGEISPALVYQIVSFVSTFKANALDWILPGDFMSAWMQDLTPVVQASRSLGIVTTVRVPWLDRILSGKMGLQHAWTQIRAASRAFGASRAALDDPSPETFDPDMAHKLAASVAKGDLGLDELEVDARFIMRTGLAAMARDGSAIAGWVRIDNGMPPPAPDVPGLRRIRLEIPGSLTGLSSATLESFCERLDMAAEWSQNQDEQDILVSFRKIGVSHAWQNLLPATATGMIMAWGVPNRAETAVRSFSELLYGESASEVMNLWRIQDETFPSGLTEDQELRLRQIGYGDWPESPEDQALLAGIDWQKVVENINLTADKLEKAASGLARNKTTLAGSYLSLQLLAWLCRFSILMPEIARRRRENDNGDGRTGSIAGELVKSFTEWRDYLAHLQEESGFEIVEMEQIVSMGLRIKDLVDGVFEG